MIKEMITRIMSSATQGATRTGRGRNTGAIAYQYSKPNWPQFHFEVATVAHKQHQKVRLVLSHMEKGIGLDDRGLRQFGMVQSPQFARQERMADSI